MLSQLLSNRLIPSPIIAANKPFKITPHKILSGHAGISIEGKIIDCSLEELYANTSVGVFDYTTALNGLRSSIFAFTGGQR